MANYGGAGGGSLHDLSLPQLLALRALMQRAGGLTQRISHAAIPGGASVLSQLGASMNQQAVAGAGNQGLTARLPAPNPAASQTAANLGGEIAWGGQRFQNPDQVAAWINARGGNTSGQQFLQNHPALQGIYGRSAQAVGAPASAQPVPEGHIAVRPHIRRAPTRRVDYSANQPY